MESRTAPGPARHRHAAVQFVQSFAAGNVDGLRPLLTDDLHLRGPLLHVHSKDAYLAALRRDPPDGASARVLSVTDDGDAVAVFWEYVKPEATLTVAQLFRFTGSLIREILVVFDPGAPSR